MTSVLPSDVQNDGGSLVFGRRKRLSLFREGGAGAVNQRGWRSNLKVLKTEENKFKPGSWRYILDIDCDCRVSRDDLITALWRCGKEPDQILFEELLSKIQSSAYDESDESTCSLLSSVFGKKKEEVHKCIHEWAKNCLSGPKFTFKELWLRRLLAYSLGLGGDLFVPSLQHNELTPDQIGETKIFKFFGRVVGILWWLCIGCILWYGATESPVSKSSSGTASSEACIVGLTDVMVPLVVLGMFVLIISPYREAYTYSKGQALVREILNLKRFAMQYKHIKLLDGSIVSIWSFLKCFVYENDHFTRYFDPRPLRFDAKQKKDNDHAKTTAKAENKGRRPSEIAASIAHETAIKEQQKLSISTLLGSLSSILCPILIASAPLMLRKVEYGSFLPAAPAQKALSVITMVLTFVVTLLYLHLIIKAEVKSYSTNLLNRWERITSFGGLKGTGQKQETLALSLQNANLPPYLFGALQSPSNISCLLNLRSFLCEEENFFFRQWNNVTLASLLSTNVLCAGLFLLDSLGFLKSDLYSVDEGVSLTVFNLTLLYWSVFTFSDFFIVLKTRATANFRMNEGILEIISASMFQLGCKKHTLMGHEIDEMKNIEHCLALLQLSKDNIMHNSTTHTTILGFAVTYKSMATAISTVLAALISGLMKMAYSK